jgi:Fe-S-cluster containining protein
MLPWYKDGLRFKCTECGQCCTGSPGYVWITQSEAEAIAKFLKIPMDEFLRKYTRPVGNRISLKEHSKAYDCVFLKGKKCQVYGVRPKQCRTFPWWKENLESPERWKETAARCEGIDHVEAPLIPLGEIQNSLPQKKEHP